MVFVCWLVACGVFEIELISKQRKTPLDMFTIISVIRTRLCFKYYALFVLKYQSLRAVR